MKRSDMFSGSVKENVYHKSFWYVSELSAYSSGKKEDRTNITKYPNHHVYDIIIDMISTFIFFPFSIIYINHPTMSIRSIVDFFRDQMIQIQRIFTDNRYSSFQIAVIWAFVGRFKNQVTFLSSRTVILKIFRAALAGGAVILKIFRAGPAGGAAVLKIFRAGPAGGVAVLKIFRAGPAGGAAVLKIFRAGLNQDLQDSRISRMANHLNHSSDKKRTEVTRYKEQGASKNSFTCSLVYSSACLLAHSSTDNLFSIRKNKIIKIYKLIVHHNNH
jgi:hypothetical protein